MLVIEWQEVRKGEKDEKVRMYQWEKKGTLF